MASINDIFGRLGGDILSGVESIPSEIGPAFHSDFTQELLRSLPAVLGAAAGARGRPAGRGLQALGQAMSGALLEPLERKIKLRPQQAAATNLENLYLPNLNPALAGPLSPSEQQQQTQVGQMIQQDPKMAVAYMDQLHKDQMRRQLVQHQFQPKQMFDLKDPSGQRSVWVTPGQTPPDGYVPLDMWKTQHPQSDKKLFGFRAAVNEKLAKYGINSPEQLRQMYAQNPQRAQQVVNAASQEANNDYLQREIAAGRTLSNVKALDKYSVWPANLAFPGTTWVDPKSYKLVNMAKPYLDPVTKKPRNMGSLSSMEMEAQGFVPLKGVPAQAYTLGSGELTSIQRFMQNVIGILPNHPTLMTVIGEHAWNQYLKIHPEVGARVNLDTLGVSESLARMQTGGALRSQQLFAANQRALDAWQHKDLPAMIQALDEAANLTKDRMNAITGAQSEDLGQQLEGGPSTPPTPPADDGVGF